MCSAFHLLMRFLVSSVGWDELPVMYFVLCSLLHGGQQLRRAVLDTLCYKIGLWTLWLSPKLGFESRLPGESWLDSYVCHLVQNTVLVYLFICLFVYVFIWPKTMDYFYSSQVKETTEILRMFSCACWLLVYLWEMSQGAWSSDMNAQQELYSYKEKPNT